MNTLRFWFINIIIFLAFYLLGTGIAALSYGDELHVLSLREFSMDAYKIGNNRDSYYQYADPTEDEGERWLGGAAVNFDLDLVGTRDWGLRWDNRVHGEGTEAQFRTVGWQYRLGLQLGPKFSLYHEHHSRHVLDADRDDKFPLENFYGARVVFFERER